MGTVLSICMILVGLGLYKKVKNGYKSKIFYKKYLPIDEFVEKILYDPQNGYYVKRNPFNKKVIILHQS